jgi:NitT/TauT family transport system permease protein
MAAFARWMILLLPLAALLGLWEFAASSSNQTAFLIGRPSLIGPILVEEIMSKGLLFDLSVTLGCALLGLIFGTFGGFGVGLAVATNSLADRAFSPVVNLLAVIPLFAAGPLLVLVAGQGLASKIFLSALSVSFFAIALTYQHAKLTPAAMIEGVQIQARSVGAAIRFVQAPYAALRLTTNLRILFGVAVTGAIVGEFLGASMGIGRFIVVAEGLFDVNRIWAGIALLSLASIIVGIGLARLEKFARRRLGKE